MVQFSGVSSPEAILPFTKICYSHKPRLSSIWPKEHDRFHDTIDDLNVSLAYSIAESGTAKDFYVPLLTHSGLLIKIGTKLMDYSNHLCVNHSLAPLYIARATKQYSDDNICTFLSFGKSLSYKMLKEVEQNENLNILLKLKHKDLEDRLNENRPVDISSSLMKKLQIFSEEYYDLISVVGQEKTLEENEKAFETPEKIKIEHIRDLFNKVLKTASTIRIAANDLSKILEQQNCVLSAIFNPLNSHAVEMI